MKKQCIICPADQSFNKKTYECNCKKNEQKTELGACIKCPAKSVYANGACNCIFNHYMDKSGKCKKCNKKADDPACV